MRRSSCLRARIEGEGEGEGEGEASAREGKSGTEALKRGEKGAPPCPNPIRSTDDTAMDVASTLNQPLR